MNVTRTAGVVGTAALVVSLAGLGLAGSAITTRGVAAEAASEIEVAAVAAGEEAAAQGAQTGPSGSGEAASAEQLAQTTPDPWDAPWGMARASAGADAAAEPAAYADGTYTGTGMGMDGRITVTLQVKDGRVACVRIEQNGETQSVGGLEAIRDGVYAALIDKAQGSAIDNVAGATITTAGVRMAVDDALAQATGAGGAASAKATSAARAASSLAEGTRPAASSASDASAAADAAKA